jgi:hypothetical protein
MADESQAMELYACSCGQTFETKGKLTGHILAAGRTAKSKGLKSDHHSKGRVNSITGEITMPPYTQRTDEEKKASKYAVNKQQPDKKPSVTQTQILSEASEFRVITRAMTLNFTVVMRTAYQAAHDLWGWNMGFEDFLDTVIWRYFKRCGVTLSGYTVEETAEEQAKRMAKLEELKKMKLQPEVDTEKEIEEVTSDS